MGGAETGYGERCDEDVTLCTVGVPVDTSSRRGVLGEYELIHRGVKTILAFPTRTPRLFARRLRKSV